jgi:hypothetical protein
MSGCANHPYLQLRIELNYKFIESKTFKTDLHDMTVILGV